MLTRNQNLTFQASKSCSPEKREWNECRFIFIYRTARTSTIVLVDSPTISQLGVHSSLDYVCTCFKHFYRCSCKYKHYSIINWQVSISSFWYPNAFVLSLFHHSSTLYSVRQHIYSTAGDGYTGDGHFVIPFCSMERGYIYLGRVCRGGWSWKSEKFGLECIYNKFQTTDTSKTVPAGRSISCPTWKVIAHSVIQKSTLASLLPPTWAHLWFVRRDRHAKEEVIML